MSRLIPLLLVLFCVSAAAQEPSNADALREAIPHLVVRDQHLTSRPWSGAFHALNGTTHNYSDFYRSRRLELNLQAEIKIRTSARQMTALALHFDNGYAAPLYTARRYIGLGFAHYQQLAPRHLISLHVHNTLKLGGRVSERPCYDDFDRRFHCGTGEAWRDVSAQLNSAQIAPKLAARWLFRF